MQYPKNFSRMAISSLLVMIVLLMLTSLAFAQEGARLYLQPVDSADGALTFDVIAENVTDMYGAEFRLKYDPAMLSVQDFNTNQDGIQIEPGSLLPVDKGFVVANKVDEAEGTITFAVTLLNPAPPANGSGPLARITFNKLQDGPATLDFERTKLVAADLQTIPSQTESFAIDTNETTSNEAVSNETASNESPSGEAAPVDNQETSAEPAPVVTETTPSPAEDSEFPWWIVAAAIMVVGIVALGAFIVMSELGPRAAQSAAKTNEQSAAAMRRTSTRPSAFK